MAKRITGLGANMLKYLPVGAIGLSFYQYYKDAGGFEGLVNDIKGFNISQVKTQWSSLAMGIGMIIGADVISRYVPGKLRYVVKAILYYLGTSQILSVLQGMYVYQAPKVEQRNMNGVIY